jgi:putative nucleotidyltransferase with HDIG domain
MESYELVKRLASSILSLRETHNHHGPNVAKLAVRLAEVAGVSPAEIELIEVGAHLHDIGKVLIRKDLLNMPRKLTGEEVAEMRLHSMYGWAIVEQAGFPLLICEIVRHHHERYDGNGYPDGLRFQEIPIGARIVSICDAYSALTSARAYREAHTQLFSTSYVQAQKGKAFDARLVDFFFEQVIGRDQLK